MSRNQVFVGAGGDLEDGVAQIRGGAAAAEDVFFADVGGGENVQGEWDYAVVLGGGGVVVVVVVVIVALASAINVVGRWFLVDAAIIHRERCGKLRW